MEAFNLLPDPQTNGGLLIAVDKNAVDEVKQITGDVAVIGRLVQAGEKTIRVLK